MPSLLHTDIKLRLCCPACKLMHTIEIHMLHKVRCMIWWIRIYVKSARKLLLLMKKGLRDAVSSPSGLLWSFCTTVTIYCQQHSSTLHVEDWKAAYMGPVVKLKICSVHHAETKYLAFLLWKLKRFEIKIWVGQIFNVTLYTTFGSTNIRDSLRWYFKLVELVWYDMFPLAYLGLWSHLTVPMSAWQYH